MLIWSIRSVISTILWAVKEVRQKRKTVVTMLSGNFLTRFIVLQTTITFMSICGFCSLWEANLTVNLTLWRLTWATLKWRAKGKMWPCSRRSFRTICIKQSLLGWGKTRDKIIKCSTTLVKLTAKFLLRFKLNTDLKITSLCGKLSQSMINNPNMSLLTLFWKCEKFAI